MKEKKRFNLEPEIFDEATERRRSLKLLAVLCYKHYMNIIEKESEEEDAKAKMLKDSTNS
jgi:hypothetical protein